MDEQIQNDINYLKNSTYRMKAFKSLAKSPKMPIGLAKDCDILKNHISNTLNQLVSHDLIYCVNPEVRKGRLYKLSEYGYKVASALED